MSSADLLGAFFEAIAGLNTGALPSVPLRGTCPWTGAWSARALGGMVDVMSRL
jgi:hypothetical protein